MNKKLMIACCSLVLLTGCDQKPKVNEVSTPEDETIVSIDKGDYSTIIPQPESEIRGVANNTIDSTLDLDAMETGLMDISKEYANPDKYIYQPGTIVSSDEATYLVDREKTSDQFAEKVKYNPDFVNIGLNMPLAPGDKEAENKIYVNTIIEQDYFTYDENNNKVIDKVAIGFGMDPTYTYTNEKGEEKTIEIKDKELVEFANSYVANRMTDFLRSKKELENVELIYGFFKESENEMYPGTYYAQTNVKPNENNVKNIKSIDQKYVLYPTEEGEKYNRTLNDEISALDTEIRGYFPYNTGTYARGYYKNETLEELYIRLTVNVYSRVDLIPFVNYVEQQINEKISEKVKINVDIRRSSGEASAIIIFDKNKNVDKYIY